MSIILDTNLGKITDNLNNNIIPQSMFKDVKFCFYNFGPKIISTPNSVTSLNTTTAFSQNLIRMSPVFLNDTYNIIAVGCRVGTTVGVASSTITLGLYSDVYGFPDELLHNFGIVAADTSGLKEIIININLNKGWYWVASLINNTTTNVSMTNYGSSSSHDWNIVNNSLASSTTSSIGYEISSTTLISNIIGTPSRYSSTSSIPFIYLRIA